MWSRPSWARVVLLVAVGFFGWAYGRSNVGDPGGYTLVAKFDRVDGLGNGADVRVSGIKVGKVLSQTLDPQTYRAEVRFSVMSAIQLPTDSSAAVVSSGLLGGKYLALVPGADDAMLKDGRRDHTHPVLGQPRGSDRPLHLQPGRAARAATPGAGRGRRCSPSAALGWSVLPARCLGGSHCGRRRWRRRACRTDVVVLQGLDKVTARTRSSRRRWTSRSASARCGSPPRACLKTPPTEPPESAAFLEIRGHRARTGSRAVAFTGWMFASSPALSALEHPVYDIWVIDCGNPMPTPPDAGAAPRPSAISSPARAETRHRLSAPRRAAGDSAGAASRWRRTAPDAR